MSSLRQSIEAIIDELGLEAASVKRISEVLDQKAISYELDDVRDLAVQVMEEKLTGNGSDGAEDSESSDNEEEEETRADEEGSKRKKGGVGKKKRRKVSAPTSPKQETKEEKQLKNLHRMVRAAGIGPIVYKGVKDLPHSEQVTALSRRLKERGVVFKSVVPTLKEIAAAQEKRDREKDLEDIDPSNIVTGPRKARENNPLARDNDDNESDDNTSNSDSEDDKLSFASEESD